MSMIHGHAAIEAPRGVPAWDVDPYDEAVLTDPAPFCAELRAQGPFAFVPRYGILLCGRYPETQEVFSDHARFVSSRGVGLQDFALEEPWRPPSIILEVDPPDHRVTNRVMMRALSPKAVAALRADFQSKADALVDALLERGSFEGVVDLAEAYPCSVFPAAVGLRENDPRRLVDYGAMVFNALGPDNALRRAAMAKAPDIVPWITAACARENLTEDGFGAAIYAAADAGEIDAAQAGMLVRSLLSAGVDTTVTGLGSALWCLAANPEAFAALRADPSLARPCYEEVLRLTTPVHAFCRTANADTEVAGVPIAEGTKILCVLGSANLDDARWEDAAAFRIDRRPAGHLAFGTGIHNCVGQNVARAEAQAILTAIAAKVGRIEMTGKPEWRPNNAIRALDRLPLAFHI